MNEHETQPLRDDPEPAPAEYEPPRAEDVSAHDSISAASLVAS